MESSLNFSFPYVLGIVQITDHIFLSGILPDALVLLALHLHRYTAKMQGVWRGKGSRRKHRLPGAGNSVDANAGGGGGGGGDGDVAELTWRDKVKRRLKVRVDV